ncbi:glycosyltransferase family 90 protein [Xylariales sp. PMI_506]|nr:glycosyltransferase family 90 protein [Xylariales sp. PMI_506]
MRAPAFPSRRPSRLVRYVVPAIVLLSLMYYLSRTSDATSQTRYSGVSAGIDHQLLYTAGQPEVKINPPVFTDSFDSSEKPILAAPIEDELDEFDHPIDHLIKAANVEFTNILARESTTLAEAAAAYRKRRGRHPPPGFKEWYQFAKEHNAVMVEDFWDQIYHDLNPFWGLPAEGIRKEAWDYEMTINIRNGNASAGSDWFWTQIWLKMIKTIEHRLPDMDIALNAMDEPRLVVPWEEINEYLNSEKKTRKLAPASEVIGMFNKLPAVSTGFSTPKTREKHWESTDPYWLIARRGCPPDSLARTSPVVSTFDRTPAFTPANALPHQYQGFVSNATLSADFCHQPDLQGLEGIFIKPLSTVATKVLFPMFGGSKLATNNEILLPAPMYWNEEERFTGGDYHGSDWDLKLGDVVWRGVGTGGRNNISNWRGFQRHRFASMNNGTRLTYVESSMEDPINFALPSAPNRVTAQKEGKLGQWIASFTDVGLTDLFCDDKLDDDLKEEGGHCYYLDQYFEPILGKPLADQFDYKFLPDIDGNSFSGRYLGFLRSTSVPIKSTLWREWHDSRLVAWKHFVPMDNRFTDYYSILEYFHGYYDEVPAHDLQAKNIAMDGKAWAEKVLRKEDMQIYVYRLLLEYARVSDPWRERMGWVEDLL